MYILVSYGYCNICTCLRSFKCHNSCHAACSDYNNISVRLYAVCTKCLYKAVRVGRIALSVCIDSIYASVHFGFSVK